MHPRVMRETLSPVRPRVVYSITPIYVSPSTAFDSRSRWSIVEQRLGPRYHALVQFVALLRGVNVGGRTIPMAQVRDCVRDLGVDSVSTVLQTGNIRLESDRDSVELKRTLETALGERFSYWAHVHLLEMSSLRRIVEGSPFGTSEPDRHSYVVFVDGGCEREIVAEVTDLIGADEAVELGDGVLYWGVPKGRTLESSFAKHLTKAKYRDFHTTRNITTLRKIIGP